MPARQLFSWGYLACRLPLLILWTIIAILTLYMSLETGPPDSNSKQTDPTIEYESAPIHRPFRRESRVPRKQLLIQRRLQDHNSNGAVLSLTASSEIDGRPTARSQASTTKKSPTSEYSRQSDIFILLVQEEDLRSKATNLKSRPANQNYFPTSSTSQQAFKKHINSKQHNLLIPSHIESLIEVLDAHRIGYSIGTTRYGMPSSLLDASNLAGGRKFSVIVIDDLIKYTKLNRWLQDQLDRYCRSNQVGVISYILDSHRLDTQLRMTSAKAEQRLKVRRYMTDQFPLTIEPLEQDCRNESTSSNCLVNYQLNHKVPILRILKSRDNLILEGKLASGSSPYMSLFSNHITYEPLTWARLRERPIMRSKRQTGPRFPLLARPAPQKSELNANGTQQTNQTSSALRRVNKRAAFGSSDGTTEGLDVEGEHNDNAAINDNQIVPAPNVSDELHRASVEPSGDNGPSRDERTSAQPSRIHQSSSQVDNDHDYDYDEKIVLSMLDHGLYDGIRRVIFGHTNPNWLDRTLLLDSIEHLSSGEIMTPLERYIQIDIDDIFVSERGTRLQVDDVKAMIETQDRFSEMIEGGFKFNLGFSGKYFKRGNELEQAGDEFLIENADKFTWFCHFWSHSKAHLLNRTQLVEEFKKNLLFAQEKRLRLIGHAEGRQYNAGKLPPTYAVAPHHSGVYPIHDELYEAWRTILNVQVTSTEEYPHLRPASGRRGFVHRSIKVLPRQTCGLYTHTIYKSKYPGGFAKLVGSIRGGELFETVLHNPVNIYMTHMSNYANDRLAPYTFNALFEFVQANTNLHLKYAPSQVNRGHEQSTKFPDGGSGVGSDDEYPVDEPASRADMDIGPLGPSRLADYYFDLYPLERDPLWTNPCADKRHLAIWAPSKHKLCQFVPNSLIVGPQKTGTTALLAFLKLNPSVKTSQISAEDFEEVQFFNDKHYWRGSDWYFSRFAINGNETNWTGNSDQRVDGNEKARDSAYSSRSDYGNKKAYHFVDKSATYFDDPKAAQRTSSLLPDAFIIILLIDPADRAYSWYQHIKAHGDPVAGELSFEEVIMNAHPMGDDKLHNETQQQQSRWASIKSLRNRCLHPAYYSSHLSNWLQFYPSRQVIIIDGQWFKYNPIAVMNRLQLLLRIPDRVDYANLLAYSEHKGFYCEKTKDVRPPGRIGGKSGGHHQLKCLGSGKGRHYEPMSDEARAYLNNHYYEHNRQLAKLLYEIGQPLPTWLDKSINQLPLETQRERRRASHW